MRINSEGNKIPIIIGLPGVAKLSTLIKYSLACGIGNSMNFLKKQGSNVLNLVKTQEPDKLVRKLAISEEFLLKNCKNIVHAVFPEKSKYHGDSYTYVSNWLSKNCSRNKFSYVPLPVKLLKNNQDLRKKLKIPKNAKVFGYHGGPTSFDLNFVKDVVKKYLKKKIIFIFVL